MINFRSKKSPVPVTDRNGQTVAYAVNYDGGDEKVKNDDYTTNIKYIYISK